MAAIIDNLAAMRVLYMLVTPFVDTAAYKLGIIDAKGTNLRKSKDLKTSAERDAYSYLHRLVFNLKKILTKLPGGASQLASIVAAMFLIKEYVATGDRSMALLEDRYMRVLKLVEDGVVLVEEELEVRQFLTLCEDGGAPPTNNTSGAAVDAPKIDPKAAKRYMARRKKEPHDPA